MSDFGDWLQAQLDERAMTKRALAEQIGVVPSTVHQWSEGTTNPSPDLYEGIASALGVDAEEVKTLASRK